MSNKWTVEAWVEAANGRGYTNLEVWRGDSLLRAISEMRKAKKTSRCVRLAWR